MTTQEAAAFLRVTPATVQRWLQSGKLRGGKVGNQWRVLKADLEAFILDGGPGAEDDGPDVGPVDQLLDVALEVWAEGREERARALFHEVERLAPDHPRLRETLDRLFPDGLPEPPAPTTAPAPSPPERARRAPRRERPVLGVDFGTTNTVATWCDERGKVQLVPVTDKSHLLPSVVWYGPGDRILVGDLALQHLIDDPVNTVIGCKRFLGRRYRSEIVSRAKDELAVPVVDDGTGGTAVRVRGEVIRMDDVAFQVIHRILELASAAAGFDFDEAVLTVPAHFSFGQRRAVRTAAEMAGVEVRAMINEPTAAALYYSRHQEAEGRVLVFDLGGGTFDSTLLSIERRRVNVLGTVGDAFLGGQDFDRAIVDLLVRDFRKGYGLDLRDNAVVMTRLRFAAERAKIRLSRESRARIRVPLAADAGGVFIDVDYDLGREELEEVTAGLVARSLGAVEDLLTATGTETKDIAEVVLVGGQTRMPKIQERLAQRFRLDSHKHVHPHLGVSVGAAILGRTLLLDRGPALADVIPAPLGVMLPGHGTREVIHRNTPLPCSERTPLQRPPLGQPLRLAVYEAFEAAGTQRELLGTLDVPAEWFAANPGTCRLEMRMGQDCELTLNVIAEGGNASRVELRPIVRG